MFKLFFFWILIFAKRAVFRSRLYFGVSILILDRSTPLLTCSRKDPVLDSTNCCAVWAFPSSYVNVASLEKFVLPYFEIVALRSRAIHIAWFSQKYETN